MSKSLYPASPAIADKSFLLPNTNFKKQAIRVIAAICWFLFVYPIVVIGAVVLMLIQILEKEWAQDEAWQSRLQEFIDADYVYFSRDSMPKKELRAHDYALSNVGFVDHEMSTLRGILRDVHEQNQEWLFNRYKRILERQLEIPEIRDIVAI